MQAKVIDSYLLQSCLKRNFTQNIVINTYFNQLNCLSYNKRVKKLCIIAIQSTANAK